MRTKPVRLVQQRHATDCGVAALAMLLRKSYGDISYVVREYIPIMPRRGLGIYHLEELAKHFGVKLRRVYRSKDYLKDRPTGILGVMGEKMCWAGHWIMLKEGVVIDPDDGLIYGLREYLKIMQARTGTLLILGD